MDNLQTWFRQFGKYLVERELHAIIRRIDLDGDGKISFKEFADFFESQISDLANLTKKPQKELKPASVKKSATKENKRVLAGSGKKKLSLKEQARKFATPSKQEANIMKAAENLVNR